MGHFVDQFSLPRESVSTAGSSGRDLNSDLSEKVEDTIESVVRKFEQHVKEYGQVNLTEALEEFWKMKLPNRNLEETSDAPNIYANGDPLSIVEYEYRYTWDSPNVDDFEDEQFSAAPQPAVVCYVFLPGGSCFATRYSCRSHTEARACATKIALLNSLFNEHPSRKVTREFINTTLTSLAKSVPASVGAPVSPHHLLGYSCVLEFMIGRSLLEYQEYCNVLRLMSWAGDLRAFTEKDATRQEVLQQCDCTKIDDSLRWILAGKLMEREHDEPSFLEQQLKIADCEVGKFRAAGKELRCPFEKRQICLLALQRMQGDAVRRLH